MQISELSAVRVIADAREHSNGFDGHDRLSNDERRRERDIDDRLEHRGHGGGGGGAPPGPITLDPMVVIHPQPAPPPIVDLPPVAALPPDAPPPPAPPPRIPSFFQLTTFSGLRRDRTAEQALEDGEWTRTVTLPAVTVVAAAPAAGMLGAKESCQSWVGAWRRCPPSPHPGQPGKPFITPA